MTKFLAKEICIGTEELSPLVGDRILKFRGVSYVETSIEYNNDYIIGKYISKKCKIITTMENLSYYNIYLSYHLGYLKRDKIDILLVSPKGNWEKSLKSLSSEEYIKSLGISGVKEIEDITRFHSIVGRYPEYCSIEIFPLRFNYELVEFCKENGIKIISYGIFGGKYESTNQIYSLTLQFLIGFACMNSDIVCIPSKHIEEVYSDIEGIRKYIGKDITDEDIQMFTMKKNINIPKIIPPRKIYSYTTNGEQVIKNSNPFDIENKESVILSFKNSLELLEENLNKTQLEEVVETNLMGVIPDYDIYSRGEKLAIYRYTIISILMTLFNTKYWNYIYTPITNGILITIKRKWFGNSFKFMLILDSTDKIYFKEINKNAAVETSNS